MFHLSRNEYSLDSLVELVRKFVQERDWEPYHKPASLAISASIEAGELLELFQWLTDEEITDYLKNEEFREALSQEIADVMIYLLRLSDVAGIDPAVAIVNKMTANEMKYPAKGWKGRIPSKIRNSQ